MSLAKDSSSSRSVTSWGPNRLDIFGLGTEKGMFHKTWDGNSIGWIPSVLDWESLYGKFNWSPAAVSWGPNRLDIFGIMNDEMFHKSWDGSSGWYPPLATDDDPTLGWESLGGKFNSWPVAVS